MKEIRSNPIEVQMFFYSCFYREFMFIGWAEIFGSYIWYHFHWDEVGLQ